VVCVKRFTQPVSYYEVQLSKLVGAVPCSSLRSKVSRADTAKA